MSSPWSRRLKQRSRCRTGRREGRWGPSGIGALTVTIQTSRAARDRYVPATAARRGARTSSVIAGARAPRHKREAKQERRTGPVDDQALHDRDRHIVAGRRNSGRRTCHRDSYPRSRFARRRCAGGRPGPRCRGHVIALVSRGNIFSWFADRIPRCCGSRTPGGDPCRGEVLFVLGEHHVVRRAESVDQHDAGCGTGTWTSSATRAHLVPPR